MKIKQILLLSAALFIFTSVGSAIEPTAVKNYMEKPRGGPRPRDNKWVVRGNFEAQAGSTVTIAGAQITSGNQSVTGNFSVDKASASISINATEGTEASLILSADDSDDIADDWRILNDESDSTFTIQTDTPIAGTYVDRFSVDVNGGSIFTANEGFSSTLTLAADQSDDNGDAWALANDASTNNLLFQNDTSGSQVTKLSIATTGIITTNNGATIDNNTSATELNLTETEIVLTGALSVNSFVTVTDTATVTTASATVILANTATGLQINLPAAGTSDGKIFTIKAIGSTGTQITVDSSAGGNIDGSSSNTQIDTQYDYITIISDGTNWHIIAEKEH